MEDIVEPHFEATVEHCRAERLLPAAQDTTALNHDGLAATEGLDGFHPSGRQPIPGTQKPWQGLSG